MQQDNISFIKIINMDQYPKTSTKIMIHQYQDAQKLKLLIIDLNWIQYTLETHTTTSILCTIPMIKLTLFMHMNNTSDNILKRRKFMNMWMIAQYMKNNFKTFIQILTITSHHRKWTQVLWLSTKMTQIIAAGSYVRTRAPTYKQVPPRLSIHNQMEDQTPICSLASLFRLHNTCKVKYKNYKCQKNPCKSFWSYHHKNYQYKHHYTTLAIIVYVTKTTKHNKSNFNQTVQPI